MHARQTTNVVLTAALAIVAGVLVGCSDAANSGENAASGAEHATDGDPGPNLPQARSRPIVYSDVHFVPGHADSLLGDPVHVGDRVVDTGSGFIHMDVTDDGVVYVTGGYFED